MADGNNGSGGMGQTKRPHEDSLEGGSAKKAKGGHDRYEIRLLIPYNTAGAIIGKGGANIKELRQEFDANVQIPDSNGAERVITITTKTPEDVANLSGKILDALNERLNHREKDGVLKLLVHKSQAGTIIGIKGGRIKELRETTGADLRVNRECCPESTDRICQIRGTKETVVKCLQIIIELLQEAPPKGPMHNYDPDFIDDSYDYGGYNRFDRDADRRRSGPGRRGGRGGRFDDFDDFRGRRGRGGRFRGDRYGGPGGFGGYDDYDDFDGGYGGGYDGGYGNDGYGDDGGFDGGYGHGGYEDEEEITTQVTIPTDLAGSIIGKGGQRINQIRQDSGAMIRINEAEPGSNERIITIVGTEAATQNAQYLLQKSVKMFAPPDRF